MIAESISAFPFYGNLRPFSFYLFAPVKGCTDLRNGSHGTYNRIIFSIISSLLSCLIVLRAYLEFFCSWRKKPRLVRYEFPVIQTNELEPPEFKFYIQIRLPGK